MSCLTDDQIVALAVGDFAAGQDHVAGCPACSSRLRDVRERLSKLEEVMITFDRGGGAGRARLLSALAKEPAPARSFFRRIVMNRRNWALAAAAALAVLLYSPWGREGTTVALADALRPFKEAKSFSCDVVPLAGGKPTSDVKKFRTRLLWAAPGSLRSDLVVGGKPQSTVIAPAGKKGLLLDHKAKTYTRTGGRPGAQEAAVLRLIEGLASYTPGDQKPAGTDDVGGVKAPRFDLKTGDAKKGVWRYRLWVDPKTKRPLRVDLALQPGVEPGAKDAPGLRMENFEWDVKLGGSFDTRPPAGYKEVVVKPADAVEQMTNQIVASLKAYREAAKSYPKMDPFNGPKAVAELERLTKKKTEVKLLTGFVLIGVLQAMSKEAVYHGKTVGPDDKDKVLFRWKLDDGSYRVIFGDLGVRTVSAEKLKALEAKKGSSR
jgi:hypothetical protein